jgi:predicted transcriptional regulator YdeE
MATGIEGKLMKTKLECREKFYVYGYSSPVINETTHEKEVELLRKTYEDKLRSVSEDDSHLYFVIWFVDENHWIYHFGISKWDSFADSKATCVEVPAGYYAVGTVQEGMPILEAWDEMFKTGFSSIGVLVDEENRKYFERFSKCGNYEIWAPVVKKGDGHGY